VQRVAIAVVMVDCSGGSVGTVLDKRGGEESSVKSIGWLAKASGVTITIAVAGEMIERAEASFVEGKQWGGQKPSWLKGSFSLLGKHLLVMQAGAALTGSCLSGRA